MKELSIEQKAQRYDEISKEVKDFFDGKLMMYSDVEQTLNYLFPELGESDDEKIRKWLLDTITQIPNDSIEWDVIEKAKVLSWLEKQGEQKPADKVKPKFHEGEWVVYMGTTAKILDLQKYYYVGKDTNDKDFAAAYCHEYVMKKWDISDAKDGDVLYSLDSNQPFIYKERNGYEQATAYCGLNIYGKFFVWGTKDCVITLSNYIPATKEQRELLFKKMKEEGYQWDADTKKLIKTTTPIPKFKFGDIIKHKPTGVINSIKYICSDYYVLDNNQALFFESQDMWELAASKANPSLEDKVSILTDEILALKQRVTALEIQVIKDMSTPPLTKDPYFKSNKITCDVFETPDKAGDNITLEDMKE